MKTNLLKAPGDWGSSLGMFPEVLMSFTTLAHAYSWVNIYIYIYDPDFK